MSRVATLLLPVALLAIARPPAARAGDAEDAARDGHAAYAAHRYREAASFFSLAITFDATQPDYYYWASMSHSAAQEDADAYEWIRGALSLKDDDPRYHAQHGRVCLFMGMPGEAVMAFEKAMALGPADARMWVDYATVLKQSGHPYQGMEALRKALSMDPSIPGLAFDLGLVLMELGDPEQAVAPLRQAVAADPGSVECRLMLGDALLDSGQPRPALAEYEAVLRLAPDDYRARQRGVRACFAMADFGCADEHRTALRALHADGKVYGIGDREGYEVDRFEVGERTVKVFEYLAGVGPDGALWSFLVFDPSGWQEAELAARRPVLTTGAGGHRKKAPAHAMELVRLRDDGGFDTLETWAQTASYPTISTAAQAHLGVAR